MKRALKQYAVVFALFLSVTVSTHPSFSFSEEGFRTEIPGIEPVESQSLDLEGGGIFYEVFGAGFPIVLIHDGLAHSAVWDAQVANLASDYLVIRYDRRGYGRSDQPAGPYSDVADLDTLINHLGIQRAILVGSSSGGGLAINYTLAHPERVEALVLVGAVVDGLGYSFHFMRRAYSNYSLDEDTNLDNWVNDPYAVAPGNDDARSRLEAILRAFPQNLSFEKGRLAQRPEKPALARLAEICAPTLIVVGDRDIPDVHVHAGAIQAGILGARLVVLDGAGHLPYLERPERFNRTVREFFDRLTVSKGSDGMAKRATMPWSSFERGVIPVDGGALYYEMMGNGESLVLMHGGLLDHRMWDDQFELLAGQFRVIRYDSRGNGLSRSPYGGHCDYEDLRVLLDSLQVKRTHIMGLSLGGRVAIDFAIEHPERVLKIVAVSPGLSGYEFNSDEEQKYMQEIRTAYIDADFDRAAQVFFRAWTIGPHRQPDNMQPELRQRVLEWIRQAVYVGMDGGYLVEADPPAVARLAEVDAPLIVIVGDQDMPGILNIADMIEKQVPGARKFVIKDAAHMVHLEKPEKFNKMILEFLHE